MSSAAISILFSAHSSTGIFGIFSADFRSASVVILDWHYLSTPCSVRRALFELAALLITSAKTTKLFSTLLGPMLIISASHLSTAVRLSDSSRQGSFTPWQILSALVWSLPKGVQRGGDSDKAVILRQIWTRPFGGISSALPILCWARAAWRLVFSNRRICFIKVYISDVQFS